MTQETLLTAEAVRERLMPVLEALEDTIREGRKTFVRGQHAAEDAAATATLHIRRHPMAAVFAAAGAGALTGAVIGAACGWVSRGRRR
jgi:ElaB/YqjD/DUF883 family membrane-anchored ribosome-binding protein